MNVIPSRFISLFNESYREEGRKFVNLFDTTAYITAGEADLDFQLFSRVFQNQKVQNSTRIYIDHYFFRIIY